MVFWSFCLCRVLRSSFKLLLLVLHLDPQRFKLIAQVLFCHWQHLLLFLFYMMLYAFHEVLHDAVTRRIIWGHALELGDELLNTSMLVKGFRHELLPLLIQGSSDGRIKDLFFEPGVNGECLTHLLHQGLTVRMVVICCDILREEFFDLSMIATDQLSCLWRCLHVRPRDSAVVLSIISAVCLRSVTHFGHSPP